MFFFSRCHRIKDGVSLAVSPEAWDVLLMHELQFKSEANF